MTHES
jgi:hypothetical protein